jgi:hypothetical protein
MSLENNVSQRIIPLRINNSKIEFYREDNGNIIYRSKVEVLREPPLNLEIGEQYTEKVGFRNLGKIPRKANAILLGEIAKVNGSEFIAGAYCHLHSDQDA